MIRSSSARPATRIAAARIGTWWPVTVVFGVALALRLFKLGSTPLWLDELYTVQLARLGPQAIWQNMALDPHPALFYLFEWLGTGLGSAQQAWAWRLIPMLCGALSAPLVYWMARPIAGLVGALVGGLALAISPMSVYFSQEARSPAMLLLLAALALLIAIALTHTSRPALWLAYGVVVFLGVASSYLFVVVPGAQLLVLIGLKATRRAALWCSAALVLACGPVLLLGLGSLRSVAEAHAAQDAPSLLAFMMSLVGGDIVRYSQTWAHSAVLGALLLLAAAGAWACRSGPRRVVMLLCLTQLCLPLAGFFGVGVPLLGFRLPLSESKTFITLLPSLYVLVAIGAGWLLGQRAGRNRASAPAASARPRSPLAQRPYGAAILAALVMLIASGEGYNLGRYWSTSKSPEADLVFELVRQAQPNDTVISLYSSISAALSFYAPGMNIYTMPAGRTDVRSLSRSTMILRIPDPSPQPEAPLSEAVRPGARVWLLYNTTWPLPAPLDSLAVSCAQDADFTRAPFRALLIARCP